MLRLDFLFGFALVGLYFFILTIFHILGFRRLLIPLILGGLDSVLASLFNLDLHSALVPIHYVEIKFHEMLRSDFAVINYSGELLCYPTGELGSYGRRISFNRGVPGTAERIERCYLKGLSDGATKTGDKYRVVKVCREEPGIGSFEPALVIIGKRGWK
jgi:hypothetical protein